MTTSRTRVFITSSLSAILAACSEGIVPPPSPQSVTTIGGTAQVVAQEEVGPIVHWPTARRVDLELSASGSMRPGQPIQIHATARARRAARNVQYEFFTLDDDENARPIGTKYRMGRPAFARDRGELAAGARQRVTGTVSFDEPGYYRVLVRASSEEGEVPQPQDTIMLNSSFEVLYLLVEERGGRAGRAFEPDVPRKDRSRVPLFGTVGRFRPLERAPEAPPEAEPSHGPSPATEAVITADGYVNAQIIYTMFSCPNEISTEPDFGGCTSFMDTYILGITVNAQCRDSGGGVLQSYALTSGNFSVYCPPGTEIFSGDASLVGQDIKVTPPGSSTPPSVSFWVPFSSFVQVRLPDDYRAHAFNVLYDGALRARERFIGYSRPQLKVELSTDDPNFGGFYDLQTDVVKVNFSRVFDDFAAVQNSGFGQQNGTFTLLHEYGHAFHWVAIEPWRSYNCGAFHNFGTAGSLSCGFVEGFADFFAAWIGQYTLVRNGSSLWASDEWTEGNPAWWVAGNGAMNEGAVAAFFYDLVDNGTEWDSNVNTPAAGEEWFDGAAYGPSYVASVIRNCRVYPLFPYIFHDRIDGIDEFIYCAERALDARLLGQAFRYYQMFSAPGGPPGWSKAMVRRLWRWNLYGVHPT